MEVETVVNVPPKLVARVKAKKTTMAKRVVVVAHTFMIGSQTPIGRKKSRFAGLAATGESDF